MKRLTCPHCNKDIYSETFSNEEVFPCPNCETSLKIEKVTDFGAYASLVPDGFISGIFLNLKDKEEIAISNADLKVFGNILVSSLDIKNWHSYPKDRLKNLRIQNDELLKEYPENDPFIDVLRFRNTLIDLYLGKNLFE